MSVTLDRPTLVPTSVTRSRGGAPRFAAGLRRHGDRVALVTAGARLTYTELADRVDDLARRMGGGRRLVLVETANDVVSVTAYLAALRAGHVVLLADRADTAQLDDLAGTFDPDVVVGADGLPRERRAGSRHALHPDLALLLATSGSSGRPRLVRLSATALESNATAIAGYLRITGDDRAALSLPLHYCYGLSVLDSTLHAGASVLLTGTTMLNPRFWETVRDERVTSLHGVPYTFDLLDAVGFADMDLPHLRYVTQAGGRLPASTVRRWAEVGRRRGWELYVMYGQTEATARMTYLPAHLAAEHPDAVGVAIPGSRLTVEPLPGTDPVGGSGVGELVFHGPGVMLGYASCPADLAVGRTTGLLRTGDLGYRGADGLFRVVGRRARFVKPFGVRVDLDGLEARLAEHGIAAACTARDETVVVAVTSGAAGARVEDLLALPAGTVDVVVVAELPRRANGKIDRPAVARLVTGPPRRHDVAVPAPRRAPEADGRGSPWRRWLSDVRPSPRRG